MIATGNLFSGINAERLDGEVVTPLREQPGLRIERIVSTGQASPPDFWYDQPETEWVVLLKGEAGLLLQGEDVPRVVKPGDWITLPPH
jgi:cupin 2 domain-containing protein